MSRLILIVMLWVVAVSGQLQAQVITPVGYLGEIKTWLVAYMPYMTLEVDPLAGIGGEAQFAAFADGKFIPNANGKPIDIAAKAPSPQGQLKWQLAKMVSPDRPNLFEQELRLNVAIDAEGRGTGQHVLLYCQLVSPQDMKASLIMGANCNSRFYINGRAIDIKKTAGLAGGTEVPIELKKGVNHVFARLANTGVAHLACRVVGENAQPLREVSSQVNAFNSTPVVPGRVRVDQPQWQKIVANIPPLPAHEHPEQLGINLARTMQLLESGKYTKRPVRIMFYGQSIETQWTHDLVQRLKERYPDTPIIHSNRAIGGWFVWRLLKSSKHDVIPWQPDLVVMSAYQGTAEVWERFLSNLRRETTADIIIRTQHLSGRDDPAADPENGETVTLRRLARKYNAELVDVRSEWMNFCNVHKLVPRDLVSDGIHLNQKGESLMAMLYERHFVYNLRSTEGWANRVRRFDIARCLEEGRTDEIVMKGDWNVFHSWVRSKSPEDSMRLKFYGTRLDLVLPRAQGGASILIDGKKPSELKLFSGTRPQPRTRDHYNKAELLMTYHMGKDMLEETWTLSIYKHQGKNSFFRLTGSKTGPDGEGDMAHDFVSRSGRITIKAEDWVNWHSRAPKPTTQPTSEPVVTMVEEPGQLVWHIVPRTMDTVYCQPDLPDYNDWYTGHPYSYVTIADGLPCGLHEVVIRPLGDDAHLFHIMGVDVHLPPMARDASHCTQE